MKYDIAETTQFLRFAIHLALILEAAKDGGFSLADAAKFLPLIKEVGPAFAGAKDIPAELKDMDMGEAFALAAMVQELTGASMVDGRAIAITERSLDVLRALLVLAQTIRGDAATLPSTPATKRESDNIDRLDAELMSSGETVVDGVLVEVRRATAVVEEPAAAAAAPVVAIVEGVEITKKTDIRTVNLPGQVLPVHVGPQPDPLPPSPPKAVDPKQRLILGDNIIVD